MKRLVLYVGECSIKAEQRVEYGNKISAIHLHQKSTDGGSMVTLVAYTPEHLRSLSAVLLAAAEEMSKE